MAAPVLPSAPLRLQMLSENSGTIFSITAFTRIFLLGEPSPSGMLRGYFCIQELLKKDRSGGKERQGVRLAGVSLG